MAEIFKHTTPFTLESGITLMQYHLAYTTYGRLNKNKDNVVWIFHALTANSEVTEWWPGLTGEGKLFDPANHFIVCVNIPGSCYGSIGPLEINVATRQPWYHDFPFFTTRDMIRAYQPLKDFLGIQTIHAGIGGSMGGQQLLEWAIEEPLLFKHVILLATNAFHSPWGIAFNATQRHAIETDPSWMESNETAGLKGMMVAREIALISYRNYNTYNLGQTEDSNEKTAHFKSESYQQYQGVKLARRFNAFSYYFLSRSMDAHNVGRQRGSVQEALKKVQAKTLVISISSDILFPPVEQELIATHIEGAVYKAIDSTFGHDGFLLEFDQIQYVINEFFGDKNNIEENLAAEKNVLNTF
ncbi:MAG: homoserine acetyltransferase [Ferruginibacter sp.]|uniref:homoserine O-acetyltransferase family protein n=1 Tax=Ferruginibacter sp. TaxID=1940288 RepID=UPI00265B1E8B|nr:homoserine O-acetyltransferase [Ferruginibacter sp.]MDB5275992.1 homoserine acetyltransferase [Ferruginibacter sp.]